MGVQSEDQHISLRQIIETWREEGNLRHIEADRQTHTHPHRNTQIHTQDCPYLFCGEHGLVRYWHIGNKRNANAIVARTEGTERGEKQQVSSEPLQRSLMTAVSGWMSLVSEW